jgi:YHS domain-containing protein
VSTQIISTSDDEFRTDIEVDPVCDRAVALEHFEQDDLIIDYAGRLYAFCSRICRDTFLADPVAFAVAGRDVP